MRADRFNLPLYLLNAVLFPNQPLPLLVFEPRYLQMIQDCLETSNRFGVVLIHIGQEVGGPAIPHDVGTIARIENVEQMPCGRLRLLVWGQSRFRIDDYAGGIKPYLIAQAHHWPWADKPFPPPSLLQTLREHAQRYLELLLQASQFSLKTDPMPQTAKPLAWWAASLVQTSPEKKQAVLETPTSVKLLQAVNHLLRQEIHVLQLMLTTERAPDISNSPFSPN